MVQWISKISIAGRVIAVALLGVALLGVVLVWLTVTNLEGEMRRQAAFRQESNMAVAWELLRHRGEDFRIVDGKLYAGEYRVNDSFEVVDRVKELVGGVATVFMGDLRVSTNVKKPDGNRAVGTKLAAGPVHDAVLRDRKPFRGEADILGEPYFTAYDPILNKGGDVIGVLFVGVKQSDYLAMVGQSAFHVVLSVVVAALLICTAIGIVIRRLLAPLSTMEEAMMRLAGNDLEVTVPATERGDEVGRMGRAVVVFKDQMIRSRHLATEQEAEQERRRQRTVRVEDLIRQFDLSASQVVNSVAAAATQLQADAQSLSSTAEQTRSQASEAATVADQASHNVETVAAATEQLNASVNEISRQVADAARVAGSAVDQASRTNTTVAGLSEAAQRIGDIVNLINDIASQTNLLALNATIEAARAGDAGKGFAVVASEVKNLASQTSKATEDIQNQVAQMQSVSGAAADAITGISVTIRRMNEIATAIASAVEQQGAATHEIARNVEEASRRTRGVTAHIGSVTEAASTTGSMARQTLGAAETLTGQAATLRTAVDHFVGSVRAA